MIDELIRVADAMKDADIVSVNWHPKLKVLPKVSKNAPCVRIWLKSDGHIKDVEALTAEQVVQLRKFEPDNGKSLPGFNVRPLYRLTMTGDESKKVVKEMETALKKSGFDCIPFMRQEDDFWSKTRDGLERSFGAVRKDIESVCADRLEKGETLQKFFDVVRQIDVAQFQKEYTDVVRRKIESGELPLSLMFYFVTEAKKQKEDADSRTPVPKFSVFLDVEDYTNYPVAHAKTISRLNSLLMSSQETIKTPVAGDLIDSDAYGLDSRQKNEKFPSVTLPFLGGVILRSQVKTIPAQRRYHQCESDTFPVGVVARQRAKAALEWITDKERDGETYGIAGDQEMLFAYPKVLPKSRVPLAKMVGAQPDANLKGAKFERLAKSVIEQLRGLGHSAAEAELELFSLRKMDKARTKVVYYRNTTVASLEAASLAWHEGSQNIPALSLRDWSENKDEKTGKPYPVPVESVTVFPVKLQRFLNTVWKRDGDMAGKVKIFEPADGLRLLLEDPCDALAKHMMERFMQHAQGYFLTLCRTQCRIDEKGRREISKLPDKSYYPGILGLLLFKLGKQKDEYMNEIAFLLGRCLRVADELHRLYCEVVRNNSLPPELCGSSLLIGTMESPCMALNQLAMRSAPYVKWARGGSDKGEKGGLVWYWLKQWEVIADQLHTQQWPKRLTPEERAKVFLGYLSSFPKKENLDGVKITDASDKGDTNE
jgi:hypothetical protein